MLHKLKNNDKDEQTNSWMDNNTPWHCWISMAIKGLKTQNMKLYTFYVDFQQYFIHKQFYLYKFISRPHDRS